MTEWLYEAGIGENRAALVDRGEIIEAVLELPGSLRAGAVLAGRLSAILIAGRRGIVQLDDGRELLLEPVPSGLSQGARLRVEVVREAGLEIGRAKRPKVRATDADQQDGPTLRDRIAASGLPVVDLGLHGPDRLEQSGWSETLEHAASGDISFAGGALRMSLTPAMTLFDVDGALPPLDLAVAGAWAAGQAIRRFDIGGSIGIDLPTLPAKSDRLAAAAALDQALPQPFERTAVNGFGFLQIVRRRERASLPELIQRDPVGAAARALLRRAERTAGFGPRTVHAAPAVIARIEEHPDWIEVLVRRTGAPVGLRAEPALAISAGHVHAQA